LCAAPLSAVQLRSGRRGPDSDHLIDELHNNSQYKTPEGKPKNDLEKEFVALDRNGDGKLEVEELMFRQYATGCEPIEAQVRANDYFRCGDLNKDKVLSLQEFKDATKPAFIDCIKNSDLRRTHGFVKFFDADENLDGFLTVKELTVGLIGLWGLPGQELSAPLIKCADKNKDSKLDQKEFHDSIAAYNPVSRTWQMWNGTSDKQILVCMESAFKKFDAALVFHATDTNKDQKISKSEVYSAMAAVNGPKLDHKVAEDIFTAGDKDKDGFLNMEEFTAVGEAYKGENEAAFYLGGHARWPVDTYDEGYGMSVYCYDRDQNEWRVFSDDIGKVTVTPKKPWTGDVTVKQR